MQVRDVGIRQQRERAPAALQRLVAQLVSRERGDRPCAATQHEHCVIGDRLPGGHDFECRNARLGSEQGDEGLVLDGLAAAQPELGASVAIHEPAPELGEELVVVGIRAVHLHQQRPSRHVPSGDDEDAGILPRRGLEIVGRDLEFAQSLCDIRNLGQAGRGAERQPHDGSRGERREQRGEHARERRISSDQRSSGSDHQNPVAEPPQPRNEMRRNRHDDRRRLGHSHIGKGRSVRRASDGSPQIGPSTCRKARRDEGQCAGHDDRADALQCDRRAPRDQRRDHEHDCPQPEHVVEERPHRVEPAREAPEKRRERPLELRGRIRRHQQPEPGDGGGQQHNVRRAPEPRPATRRRIDADAHPWPATSTPARIAMPSAVAGRRAPNEPSAADDLDPIEPLAAERGRCGWPDRDDGGGFRCRAAQEEVVRAPLERRRCQV